MMCLPDLHRSKAATTPREAGSSISSYSWFPGKNPSTVRILTTIPGASFNLSPKLQVWCAVPGATPHLSWCKGARQQANWSTCPSGGAGLSETEWQGTVGTRQPISMSLPPATPDCAHPHAPHCHTPSPSGSPKPNSPQVLQELCFLHLGLGGAVHTCLPSPAGKSPAHCLVDTFLLSPLLLSGSLGHSVLTG